MTGLIFLIFLLPCHILCAYYTEKHYEGISSDWKDAEGTNARLEIIAKFLPSNPIVFEVGAEDGADSIKLAQAWPLGQIISFEPNPRQFNQYYEKSKNFSNMVGYNLAVNTYNGTASFYLCWGTNGNDPYFEGASSLLLPSEQMKIHYMGPEITVPCVVFDDWCIDQGINAVDFIWLDIEGFEMQFLQSSPNILETVRVIYTETNFFKFREGTTQFTDLKAYLESMGFSLIAHWYCEGLQGDAIFLRTRNATKR